MSRRSITTPASLQPFVPVFTAIELNGGPSGSSDQAKLVNEQIVKGRSPREVARTFNVHSPTVYRVVAKNERYGDKPRVI